MAFVNERMPDGKYAIIDRKNGITLIHIGQRGPSDPVRFELIWNDRKIPFQAFRVTSRTPSGGHGVIWDIVKLSVPEELEAEQEPIFQQISGALDAFGIAANRENVEFVKVTFVGQQPEI